MAKQHVTEAELRARFIENAQETPWARLREGDYENRCSDWCEKYRTYFEQHGIECARLSSGYHAYLAVNTTDKGILVFDPTFKQFYDDYPTPYFLGSAQELVDHIEAHGGWERMWADGSRPVNARGAFGRRGVDLPLGVEDRAAWHAALEPLPQQRLWADRSAQARSSNEVSP